MADVSNKNINPFWSNVTAFGALWGAMEITLGSFIHAMRFPFSGSLLAALGAAILVIQRQILPMRGSSLATGFVAAMCKSISPGGIILGPMVAIATEGLLVEIALFFGQRSLLPAIMAGVLCALWSVCQKLLMHYVLYGWKVLELYFAAIVKAGDWMGMSAKAGWWSLTVFLGTISFIGALGGLIGRRIGNDSRRRLIEKRSVI
ncbi:MAG: hypothetical protein V1754_14280 [Pseudomonadota bacterium]